MINYYSSTVINADLYLKPESDQASHILGSNETSFPSGDHEVDNGVGNRTQDEAAAEDRRHGSDVHGDDVVRRHEEDGDDDDVDDEGDANQDLGAADGVEDRLAEAGHVEADVAGHLVTVYQLLVCILDS